MEDPQGWAAKEILSGGQEQPVKEDAAEERAMFQLGSPHYVCTKEADLVQEYPFPSSPPQTVLCPL